MEAALKAAKEAAAHYKGIAADPNITASRSEFLQANRENAYEPNRAPAPAPAPQAAPDWGPAGGGDDGGWNAGPRHGRRAFDPAAQFSASGIGGMLGGAGDAPAAAAQPPVRSGISGLGVSGGGLAPATYADGLRAQVEERQQRQAQERARAIEAERADDLRIARDQAQGQRQVEAEFGAQRDREAAVRRREEWAAAGWGQADDGAAAAGGWPQQQQQQPQQQQPQQQVMHGRRAGSSRDSGLFASGDSMGPARGQEQAQADVSSYMHRQMAGDPGNAAAATPAAGGENAVASMRRRQMSSSIF